MVVQSEILFYSQTWWYDLSVTEKSPSHTTWYLKWIRALPNCLTLVCLGIITRTNLLTVSIPADFSHAPVYDLLLPGCYQCWDMPASFGLGCHMCVPWNLKPILWCFHPPVKTDVTVAKKTPSLLTSGHSRTSASTSSTPCQHPEWVVDFLRYST